MEQTLKPLQIAVGKIECTENKGETIYRIFGRDKFLNKQCINVYNFLPYFYLPQHTSVIKDKNLVRIEKTNKLTMDNIHVKKVYMKNWKALGLYDDNGYCKKYSKTYETDVDESNRLAIDLNIKSGVRVYNEEVDFGKDSIEPVDFKIDLRRVHLDIEVSTKLTNKLPDWENPIEPIYTLANFDTYTEKFTYFVQHPEYKNKTYYNTTYSPDLKHIITIKINSLKKQLADLDVTYKRVKDMKIKIEEITDDQLNDIGDLIIYFFKYEKLKNQIDSFNSRLENIIKSFKPKYKVKFITFDNEKDMLEHYIKYIDKIDPDIITGWNSQGFDIPYIIARMQKLQVDARKLSPINNVYIKKKQGIGIIRGRVVFDTWKGFKKQQTHGLESYKLDFVAQTLFAVGKVEHEGINKMYDEDRMLLAKYNIQDVFLEYAISKDQGIFEFFYDVKCYAGCSFEDVLDNSHIVDTYMLFKAKDQNMVLPNKPVVYSEESFEGATVFTPNKIGIQHWVAVFDLKSLYPNIMRTLNIGEDTLVVNPSIEQIPKLIKTPIDGIYFRKDKQSFLSSILSELLDYRDQVKAERKAAKKAGNLILYELKNRLQTVIKFITNSIWGVIGWNKFRLYNRYIAACITAVARIVISFSGKIAVKQGYKIYYGDTDSIFVIMIVKSIYEIKKDMINLAIIINQKYDSFYKIFNVDKHYFQMNAEKLFKNVFMVRKKDKDEEDEDGIAKKKYAGWIVWNDDYKLEETVNKMDIKGFDRSDMSRVGNKIMKEVLQSATCNFIEKVVKYISTEIKKIKTGKYDIKELAYTKGISKSLDEYKRGEDWIQGAIWTNTYSYLWGKHTNYGANSKPKYVYVLKSKLNSPFKPIQNNHKYQPIALDEDNELPDVLIKAIDWKTLIDKSIGGKIDMILEAIGLDWDEIFYGHHNKKLMSC